MKYIIKLTIFIIIIIFAYTRCFCITDENNETNVSGEEYKSIINVNANVDKAKITIGDKIRYKITVNSPEEVEILLPDLSEKIGDLIVVDFGAEEPKKDEGNITAERWYILETYTTGSYIIPAIDIKYKEKSKEEIREVKTSEIFVEVLSVLDEDAGDIRDIIPPVTLNKNYYRLYIIIAITLGVLGAAGAIILFLYRRKHRKVEFKPEPLSAHEIAYNELENLKAINLTSKGKIKEYYYRLSDIVRRYIENRFRLMAPERTTEEFLAEMAITNKLEENHKQLISNFLEHCDLVKYAKYGPNNQEIEEAFNSAKKLVDETKEVLEPVLSGMPA